MYRPVFAPPDPGTKSRRAHEPKTASSPTLSTSSARPPTALPHVRTMASRAGFGQREYLNTFRGATARVVRVEAFGYLRIEAGKLKLATENFARGALLDPSPDLMPARGPSHWPTGRDLARRPRQCAASGALRQVLLIWSSAINHRSRLLISTSRSSPRHTEGAAAFTVPFRRGIRHRRGESVGR